MSGTPNKRVQEKSGGHPCVSRYSHLKDDSGTFFGMGGTSSKLPNPSAPSDYHTGSFDTVTDSRMPKVPRTEMNNRTLLFQKYMVPSSSLNDSQADHAVNPENRVELRGSRDSNIGDPKVESRDVKTESKEVYQSVRSDKGVRYTSRGDDHKDMKLERDSYSHHRNEVNADTDAYDPVNCHTNLKEPKDHQRAWKHPDSRSNLEVARESLTPEMKDATKDDKEGGLQHEKEDMDMEKLKLTDNWKEFDKECKDRRIKKDADKGFDKDSDDGGADVDRSADKERDGFSNGVQQKKRMLRPEGGSSQITNQGVRSRSQDNDGSIGKGDVSTVVYRVGECMQELIKLWKEYQTSSNVSGKMPETSKTGPTLEICIPAEHVTATNRQVKGGQLWGTDIYTDDSDLVAVLMHTGYCRPTASPPPPAVQELRATVRVLPPQDCYVSTLRNNVRSRAWGAASGCSFSVERCHIVKKDGGTINLEPCLTHTSTVEPTLAPVVAERTITTRAAASNALRQQRFAREVTLQYNLCNEPWIKYSISAIADKGLKKPLFTSARLKKGEVLYLESRTRRYELCFNGEKMVKTGLEMEMNGMDSDINNNTHMMDVFRWSECKKPLPQTVMLSIGIPLPPEHLRVLEESLDWEDIQWSQTGVWISGKEYPLSRVHFLSPI